MRISDWSSDVCSSDLLARLDSERGDAACWRVTTSAGAVIDATAVVIAAGCGAFGPNRPPLPGLEDYEATSVHYLVQRRASFRGRRIVIAGGGDFAVDWANPPAELAAQVDVSTDTRGLGKECGQSD